MAGPSQITRVSGTVVIDGGLSLPEPLKYQTVVLLRGDTEIARSMSDASGVFALAGEIPDGVYQVTLVSAQYQASENISISKYKTEGLQLLAKPK